MKSSMSFIESLKVAKDATDKDINTLGVVPGEGDYTNTSSTDNSGEGGDEDFGNMDDLGLGGEGEEIEGTGGEETPKGDEENKDEEPLE
jgi:hypothetical protein